MIAGPASMAATRPVMTKMPAPMIAPMPRDVSPTGPSTRRSRFSPSASARSVASDFLANSCLKNIAVLSSFGVRRFIAAFDFSFSPAPFPRGGGEEKPKAAMNRRTPKSRPAQAPQEVYGDARQHDD